MQNAFKHLKHDNKCNCAQLFLKTAVPQCSEERIVCYIPPYSMLFDGFLLRSS